MAKRKTEKLKKEVEADFVDQDAIDLVNDCKDESLDFYAEKFKKFLFFDRLYIKGAYKSNVPYGRANLKLPYAFQQLEPFVTNMTEAMISEAPWIAYQGRQESDDENAEKITEYTQFELEEGCFIPEQMQNFRGVGKYGTGIMKIRWDYQVEEYTEEKQDAFGNTYTETEPVILHDGPIFEDVCIYDFFVPKSATSCSIKKLDWCAHRVWRNIDQLIANPNYKNKKYLKALRDDESLRKDYGGTNVGSGSMTSSKANIDKKTALEMNNPKGAKKFSDKCEVLEWWGNYSPDKKSEKVPYLIVIANVFGEWILMRSGVNPFKYKFKPFAAANDYPIQGEFYGYGELDHIEGFIQEGTALRNARLDICNQSLNGMWLVERQAGINLRELYSAPNKIILTNDNNGIKPLTLQGVTQSSVEELAKIDFDIQNTTEIINPRQDVGSIGAGFGQTATGVQYLSGKAQGRILTKARLIEQTYFKELGGILLMMNKELVTDEMYYRTTDDTKSPYSAIGPDAFASEVDFKTTTNPDKLTNAEKRSNLEYLLQVTAQIEKVKPGVNNYEELLPDVYKIAGFPHPDKYINPQQTTILQLPNGQVVDSQGRPVNVVPVDEKGQPLQEPAMPAGTGTGPMQ